MHEIELKRLLEDAFEKLKKMPQPVVRVCGPLSSGAHTYEENLTRFKKAEDILEGKGFTVFRFDEFLSIFIEKDYSSVSIQNEFHAPLLKSGLIAKGFFLPYWNQSQGTTWERNFIEKETNISIEEFPEEWLE